MKNKSIKMERILFSCSCYHPEHHFFVLKDDEEGNEFFAIQLRPSLHLPWYKRIWAAIKYAFGLEVISGYEEVLLNPDDRNRLIKALKVKTKPKLSPEFISLADGTHLDTLYYHEKIE